MSDHFSQLRHSRDCTRAHLPANYDRGGEVLTLGACTCGRDEIVSQAIKRERWLQQALSDIQFDLINCHEAAGRNACEHIKDAITIVNRTLQQADSRSLNENCRCGRSVLFPGDADPWCAGCNMSAATCDCAEAEPRAALAYEYP